MTAMITVKRFTLRGKVVEPRWKIRTSRPEVFIQKGLARAMTNEEIRAMLDEYVTAARRVFSIPRVANPKKGGKGTFEDIGSYGCWQNKITKIRRLYEF